MAIHDFNIVTFSTPTQAFIRSESLVTGQTAFEEVSPQTVQALCQTSFDYSSAGLSKVVSTGRAIYDDLLTRSIRTALRTVRERALHNQDFVRIVIRVEINSVLQEIPWELMHDGHRALALDPFISIVRYVEQRNPQLQVQITDHPIRILFTTACPPEESPLNIQREEEILRVALAPLGKVVRLTAVQNVSKQELRNLLVRATRERQPFHIWHHCGHGGLSTSTGEFKLILDENHKRQIVSTQEIAQIMADVQPLHLAILNTCYSSSPTGLAASLAGINIPTAIGFRDQVVDQVALDFSQALYYALLDAPIDLALQHARRSLFDPIRPLDWMLPILFLRAQDSGLR